jgi:hypothetical protein
MAARIHPVLGYPVVVDANANAHGNGDCSIERVGHKGEDW